MSNEVAIPLGHQAYQARSRVVIDGQLENLYPEQNPQGAKSQIALYNTPGLSAWTTVGDGPIRGIHVMGNDLYVVSGQELYAVSKNKVATLIGEVVGADNVFMTDNGTHVAITTSTSAYAANKSEILELPENGLGGATYQDGYGIFIKRGSEQFYITNLDDMTTITATDFSSADTFADNLVGLVSDHRELWLMGERSIEVWLNQGLASFPFTRAGAGFIERGCISGQSVVKIKNRVFWLGDDLAVYMAAGYEPQRISTPAIDKLISERTGPQTAKGFHYDQEGHAFYVLTFSDMTFVFDMETGTWHTRMSENSNGRWRANNYAWYNLQHLVGDYANNNIYELDLDVYADNGSTVIRKVTSNPIEIGYGKRGIMDEVHLDMEMGVGITSGQGSDPEVMLEWSDDQGNTWSSERIAKAGKIGEYTRRARWHRLGSFRDRTLRFSISDPVKTVILKCSARIEALDK